MFFNQFDEEKGFKVLSVLHGISFVIQAIAILIAYLFVVKKEIFTVSNIENVIYIQYFVIMVAIIALPLSEYFIKQRLKKSLQILDRTERIETFTMAIIFKLGIIEFINLFTVIVYFLSGHKSFLYISIILVIFFLFSRPIKEKILNDLNL